MGMMQTRACAVLHVRLKLRQAMRLGKIGSNLEALHPPPVYLVSPTPQDHGEQEGLLYAHRGPGGLHGPAPRVRACACS